MSSSAPYIRRDMDKEVRKRLGELATAELGANASTVEVLEHLIDNFAIDPRRARHYVIWMEYRHRLRTTTANPRDIILQLAADYGTTERTVYRIVL